MPQRLSNMVAVTAFSKYSVRGYQTYEQDRQYQYQSDDLRGSKRCQS
jgi:hypothetical protein